MNDRSCFEAFKKVEEFKLLHNKSQEKVEALKKDISQLKAAMVDMDMEKYTLSEQVKEKEQQLQSSKDMVTKQAAVLNALKVEIVVMKKVTI